MVDTVESRFEIQKRDYETGRLITRDKEGRTPGDGLTVFKSVGLAIQDSSVASLVLRKYREAQ